MNASFAPRVSLVLALLLAACGPRAEAPSVAGAPAVPASGAPTPSELTPSPPVRVRLAISSLSGVALPYSVTQEAGLFTQHGLAVEMSYIASTTAMGALLGNDVDVISTSGPELVAAGIEGAEVVAVASTLNKIVQSLFVAPSIQTPEALRGRQVGITRHGSLADFSARYLLRQWGLQPDRDVALLQMGGIPETLAAFAAGGLEAGILTPPQTLLAQDLGFVELANLQTQPLEYPANIAVMHRPTRPEGEEVARRFVRAVAEGIHRLLVDRPFAVRVLQAQTRTDDPRALEPTYDLYAPLYEKDLRLSRDSMRTARDQMAATNPKAADADVERLLDSRFVDELARSGLVERLYATKR